MASDISIGDRLLLWQAQSFAIFFNAWIWEAQWRSELSISLTAPLPKDVAVVPSASAVRPIALGQFAAKIFSRCLASWLYPLVTPHIHGLQHGFSAGRGTDSALLALELAVFGLHSGKAPEGWLILLDITRVFPSLRWTHLEGALEHSDAPLWLRQALLTAVCSHRAALFLWGDGLRCRGALFRATPCLLFSLCGLLIL